MLKVPEEEKGNVWREDTEVSSFCQLANFFLYLLGESCHRLLKLSLLSWKKTAVHDGNQDDHLFSVKHFKDVKYDLAL